MMDATQQDRLHVVNNSECMLLEFINESDSLAVGFLNWMKDDDIEQVQNLIHEKKEVEVMWPDCPIKTALYMKNLLPKANFMTHVARILDVGGKCT